MRMVQCSSNRILLKLPGIEQGSVYDPRTDLTQLDRSMAMAKLIRAAAT